MKTKVVTLMILGLAATLSGCIRTEYPSCGEDDSNLPVLDILGAGVQPEEVGTRAATRAGTRTVIGAATRTLIGAGTRTTTTVRLTSGSIGLFLTNTDPDATDPPYMPVNNRKYTYDGGTSKWTTDKAIFLGGENAYVCAYYPYDEAQKTMTLSLATQQYKATKDCSYAKNITVNGNPYEVGGDASDGTPGRHVTFILKRAYSRAKFTFTRKNYVGEGKITQIELKNLPSSEKLDITTGTYTDLTKSDKICTVDYALPTTADPLTIATTDELLIAPGKFVESSETDDTKKLALILTIDGKTMTTYISPATMNEFIAGKYYNFKINVNGSDISLSTVELNDWEVTNIDNDGDPFETEPTTRISILSASMEAVTGGMTRAETSKQSVTNGTLGLFLRGKTEDGYKDKNNLAYSYSSGGGTSKWQPVDADNTLYLGKKSANVCAYYPRNAGEALAADNAKYSDPTQIPLKSQKFSTNAANLSYDINREMWGGTRNDGGKSKGDETTFTLKRAYAKLGFTFTREHYPSAGNLTKITLSNCNTKNTVDITSGTFATASNIADLSNTVNMTIPKTGSISTEDGSADKNTFLIVPGTIPANAKKEGTGAEVTLTVDGKDVRVLIPTTILGSWEAGKAYNIKIKLLGRGIELQMVEIRNWDEKKISDGGKPFVPKEEEEEIDGIPVVFRNTSGVEKTVIFSKSQLYYNSETKTWGWGKEQCDYGYEENNIEPGVSNDALLKGPISYYFMFGKPEGCIYGVVDGYYSGTNLDLSGTEYDPCQKMGKEWVSPTVEILNMMILESPDTGGFHPVDQENNRMEISSDRSRFQLYTPNKARKSNTPVQGLWVNVSNPQEGDTQYNSSRLFLPAAGGRVVDYGPGIKDLDNMLGYYWSSQQKESTSSTNTGQVFLTYFKYKNNSLGDSNKNNGYTIRCCRIVK